jgi:arylformamidase
MDLEAEYNNSAKVPGSDAIVARWEREAAAFRAAHVEAELAVRYGPTPRQALDIFWPGPARAGRVAMFIHGGYWQRLDRSWFSHLARGLLVHGIAVAMPSYDLCPTVTLAALVEQVRGAAAFLARRHGGGMLAAGHSAGGHLAAMLLATDWAARGLPEPAVRAALPISGLFDLPPLTHTTVNDALRLSETEAHRLSPLFLPRPAGRLHAVVGDQEGVEYTRQTRSIAEAWGGRWEALRGRNHFTAVEPLGDPESHLVNVAIELLSSGIAQLSTS